jgi:hypothetical protein
MSSTTEEKECMGVGEEFSRVTQDRYAEELAEKSSEIEREGIFGGTCQRWRRRSIPVRDKNSKLGADLLAWDGEPDIARIAVVNQGRMWSVDQPSCGQSWGECSPLVEGAVRVPGIEKWRGDFSGISYVIGLFNIDCTAQDFYLSSSLSVLSTQSGRNYGYKRIEGIGKSVPR